jgi:ABC-type Fe3+ transport system permease subunit
MTVTAQLGWTLARSAGIALAALAMAFPIRAFLAAGSDSRRRTGWTLLFLPYLTPVLLVGYAYSNFSLSLVHHPHWNAALYALLLWMKLVPVAVLVLYFAPSSFSAEAVHCHRLLQTGRQQTQGARFSALLFRLRGSLRGVAVAFAAVFLLAFGEFEMASLVGVKSWTVSLFDAQAGGLSLRESLRLAAAPIVCEAILLLVAFAVLFRNRNWQGSRRSGSHASTLSPAVARTVWAMVWFYLAVSVGIVTMVPLFVVLKGTAQGLTLVLQSFALGKELAVSVLFAAAAAAGAYAATARLLRRRGNVGVDAKTVAAAFFLSAPGLLGALLLALIVLAVFQLPAFRAVYNTPLPLLLALVFLLVPFAVLMHALLAVWRHAPALHLARLLRASSSDEQQRHLASRVIWRLDTHKRFWAGFLLFCWAYFDLTAASILAPPGLAPAFVRLYNLTHYGQSAVLSAMICVAFVVPVILFFAAEGACKLFARWYYHE